MNPLTLIPRPPFDFSLSAAIFSNGDPAIRTFRDGMFRQVLDTGRIPVLVEVRSSGTPEYPRLELTLRSSGRLQKSDRERAGNLVASLFSISDDMEPFYRAVAKDPVLADLTVRLRGTHVPVTATVFEALTDSIIEQQISLKAATSIESRLIRATGKELVLDGTVYHCYPDPQILAGTSDSTFRSCGLTIRKGEYIRGVSQRILAGDLDVEGFRNRRTRKQSARNWNGSGGSAGGPRSSPSSAGFTGRMHFLQTMWACAGSCRSSILAGRKYRPRMPGHLQNAGAPGRDLLHTILRSRTCSGYGRK